ncbi:MAG: pantoate--beta-alanine ligase [Candidatus Latescibacterota bacterium]|nr:MAG: pantoate--beta-alanine ligase [Candidatus Latescibacterota bacterium]
MKTFDTIDELRAWVGGEKRRGLSVAFVPTMGALHGGHRACIEKAAELGDVVVVSIFVNPTQFGPGEDLDKYPATLDKDLELCRNLGVAAVFVPETREMYTTNQNVWVEVEGLTSPLCGRSRPGHFRGVATVVAKLFNIVAPDTAVFGQKDAQQAVVINEMVTRLNLPVRVALAPTIREPDGLALSSRNGYLGDADRQRAASIYQALLAGRDAISRGDRTAKTIIEAVQTRLATGGIDDVEYVELVTADTLEPIDRVEGRVLLGVAVRIGTTRLIDNVVLTVAADGGVTEAMLF